VHSPRATEKEAERDKPPHVTPPIASEAAVWVSRLHGPDRSRAMELECLAWQSRSAGHRHAFERCTETWQAVSGVTLSTYARAAAPRNDVPARRANTRRAVLASSALGCAAMVTWQFWPAEQAYGTEVGEQRAVMLADGTRMTLNTSTDVRVELTKAQRTVSVLRGEALFEVAKEPGRPFVVQVSGAKVVATGTAFLIRSTPRDRGGDDAFGVTLIEGQVIVHRSTSTEDTAAAPIVMAPGDRLRVARSDDGRARRASSPTRLDRPQIGPLMAWQRGEAVFDDMPLLDAVAEMNRYSKVRISLVGDALNALRVSGVFRTGDNESFARAAARLHGLTVRERSGYLELAKDA
jgi:transmembrane sensor